MKQLNIEDELNNFNADEYRSYFKMRHNLKNDQEYYQQHEHLLNNFFNFNDFKSKAYRVFHSINSDLEHYKNSKSIHRFKNKKDYKKKLDFLFFSWFLSVCLVFYCFGSALGFIYFIVSGSIGERKGYEKIYFGRLDDAHYYNLRNKYILQDIETLKRYVNQLKDDNDKKNAILIIEYLENKITEQKNFLLHAKKWDSVS